MKLSIREMVLISLFTALTAIGAFLNIPIGDVPITLQSMFTLLSGLLLGPKLGALSQLIYLILGLSGMRIFAGFTGGPQAIFKPSFGFLIGFIFASFAVGRIRRIKRMVNIWDMVLATSLGTLIIYLFGIPYMYIILNKVMGQTISFAFAIKMGCLVFLPGDALKVILTSLIAYRISRNSTIPRL